jgi:hypothetical protein
MMSWGDELRDEGREFDTGNGVSRAGVSGDPNAARENPLCAFALIGARSEAHAT